MVVPSLKSNVSSELLPSEWLAMKCQMRAQVDEWLRVRGLERQSFTLLNPKEPSIIGLWQVPNKNGTQLPLMDIFMRRHIYGLCCNTCIFQNQPQLWIWFVRRAEISLLSLLLISIVALNNLDCIKMTLFMSLIGAALWLIALVLLIMACQCVLLLTLS